MSGRLTRTQRTRRRVEDALVALGFSEVYTPSLVEDDVDSRALRLPEPITVELAVLRTELLPSLVEAARRNVEVGNERVALFEIARVYLPAGDASCPTSGRTSPAIVEGGFPRVKGVVEALLRALHADATWSRTEQPAVPSRQGRRIEAGLVGELHPPCSRARGARSSSTSSASSTRRRSRIAYEDVITYPAVLQDIAVAVARGRRGRGARRRGPRGGGPPLREARVFDVYRGDQVGEGRKSVALHLSFQSPERTLTDEEAAELRGGIVAALADRFGAELRA